MLRPGGRLVVVKDGGPPGGTEARQELVAELDRSGLAVMQERDLAADDVTCTMWVCGGGLDVHCSSVVTPSSLEPRSQWSMKAGRDGSKSSTKWVCVGLS